MFLRLVFKRAKWNNFWGKLISWKTGSPYCHVEIWFDGDAAKALTYSAKEPKGTRFTYLDLTEPGLWDFIEIPATIAEVKGCIRYARDLGRKAYDWLGIIGFVLPWSNAHDADDRFCSEVCDEVLTRQGMLEGVEPRWKVSPGELAQAAGLKWGAPHPVMA